MTTLTIVVDVLIFAAGWIVGKYGWPVVKAWVVAAYHKITG